MNLIGISAKMGCGKTTLTMHLIGLLGVNWTKVSLGDALKEEVSDKFKFPLKWCYTEEGKSKLVRVDDIRAPYANMSVRTLLQWWGTEIRRAEDPLYWVDKTLVIICELINKGKNVIVDDVRFPDEVNMIKYLNGFMVRLEAYPGYTPLNKDIANHPSEIALDDYKHWDIKVAPKFGQLELSAKTIVNNLKLNQGEEVMEEAISDKKTSRSVTHAGFYNICEFLKLNYGADTIHISIIPLTLPQVTKLVSDHFNMNIADSTIQGACEAVSITFQSKSVDMKVTMAHMTERLGVLEGEVSKLMDRVVDLESFRRECLENNQTIR